MKSASFDASFELGFLGVLFCCVLLGGAAVAEMRVVQNEERQTVDVFEDDLPVLRFNHGTTAVPDGTDPKYARGDYIHPLYGPNGEVLTDDYPQDHPHHRGVNWSWATLRWRGETRDMFAVRGVWARPVSLEATSTGPAVIVAHSVWKWDDEEPVADEKVTLTVHPQENGSRAIGINISLKALVKGFEIGGRLGAGYSGFNVRMAPADGQQIVFHRDPVDASPCRCWADYSAEFAGGKGRAGVTIVADPGSPGYPNEWREYPGLNYFQPLFPGDSVISLSDEDALVLDYVLWLRAGSAEERIADIEAVSDEVILKRETLSGLKKQGDS